MRVFSMASEVSKQTPHSAFLRAMYYQVEGNCPTEKIRNVGTLWGTLSPQEKAKWEVLTRPFDDASTAAVAPGNKVLHRSAELTMKPRGVKRKLVPKAPKQNPYGVFVKAMHHQVEGDCPSEKIRNLGALWRTLDPQQKAEWAVRALSTGAIRNVCVVPLPLQRLPSARGLYFKAKMTGSPQERMRDVAAQWIALSKEQKAVWNQKAAKRRVEIQQKTPRAPKHRSGYQVFIADKFSVVGGRMSLVAAAWKAASTEVRQTYTQRAAELNASVATTAERPWLRAPSSPRFLSAINLFVKEQYNQAPVGSPSDRMRHVGLQWTALSTEAKAVWAHKAAEVREAILHQAALTRPQTTVISRVTPLRSLANAVSS